jgi:hypothetical protein
MPNKQLNKRKMLNAGAKRTRPAHPFLPRYASEEMDGQEKELLIR